MIKLVLEVAAMNVFDSFDRIRIVNLPRRVDRRRMMERELDRMGLTGDPRLQFFPAVEIADKGPFRSAGSHGCFISHRRILEDASRDRCSVLILQDDCKFLPQALTYERPECEVFYGGYVASDPSDPENSDIIGAHFMGFSIAAAQKAAHYLSLYLRDPYFEVDARAIQEPSFDPKVRPPIDGALVWFRRAHPELTSVFEMLSVQRSSRTDIGNAKWFDKVPILQSLAEFSRTKKSSSIGEKFPGSR